MPFFLLPGIPELKLGSSMIFLGIAIKYRRDIKLHVAELAFRRVLPVGPGRCPSHSRVALQPLGFNFLALLASRKISRGFSFYGMSRPPLGSSDDHVGTAALASPVEQSSTNCLTGEHAEIAWENLNGTIAFHRSGDFCNSVQSRRARCGANFAPLDSRGRLSLHGCGPRAV